MNEPMMETETETTETETDNGTVITVETPADETADTEQLAIEAETEQTEIVTDSAVEIARIEADKEIQIAEINAAVAMSENDENEGQETWQVQMMNTMLTMGEQMQTLTQTLMTRMDLLIPPPLPMDSTPPSMSAPTSEIPMEVIPENVEENPVEPEQPPQKAKIRRL